MAPRPAAPKALAALFVAACLSRPALLDAAASLSDAAGEEANATRRGGNTGATEVVRATASDSNSSTGVVTEVDTVGVIGTDKAKGGFSFAPRAPTPQDVEVSVSNASLARLFEELLTGHAIPGSVDIVAEKTGVIEDGTLSDILIKQASVKETLMLSDTDKEQVIIKVPDLACTLSARYDVRFTKLSIPEHGTMNMSLGGGGVRLSLPASGAGAGSCHFDAALRMKIQSAFGLDTIGGDAVDSSLRSMAVAINDNLLSLQDRMLHTIETSLCSALLAGLGDPQVHLPAVSAGQDTPAWEATLADMGLSPLALAAAAAMCCFGWCLGACCCGACARRKYIAREAETLPLKQPDEDPYMSYNRAPKSILNSLACCRRSAPPARWKQDGM